MLSRSFRYQASTAVALALLANASVAAAPAPVVDTKSTSTSSNVSREQLENLPAGRRVEDLIKTCPSNTIPTISRQSDVLIDGKPAIDINCVQPDDLDMIEVYKTHNSARAEYGAAPLVWDPLLINGPQGAQSHVNQLARTGTLFHASREGRGTVRENIGQGLAGSSVGQLLGGWTKEKQNFVPGTFPNVSRTGNWYDIGHWAQMIWISTVLIGCAKAAGIGNWLVCRYDPGGNKDGKTVGLPPPRPYLVEAPTLPKTEVFGQNTGQPKNSAPQTTTIPDTDIMGRRASLFDLGIYAGGAWTTDWFKIAEDDPVIASTNLDLAAPLIAEILTRDDGATTADNIALNYEYGYDGGLFVGYDLGAFRIESEVAYKKADLESYSTNIRLPGETPNPSVGSDDGMGRRASMFDLGIYGGGAWTSDWFSIGNEDPYGVGVPGGFDVNEAFAEIRIPLLSDNPFFEPDLRYSDPLDRTFGLHPPAYVPDSNWGGAWTGQDPGSQAGNGAWSQDSVRLGDYFSLNVGVRADAYDPNSPPPSPILDFGTHGGAGAAYANAIDWTPIEDLLFRGSWAEGFGGQVHVDGTTTEILVDTKVEPPTLQPTEVFNPTAPKVAVSGKQEPSNPNTCSSVNFWEAENMYRAGKAKGDIGGMATAKAWMANIIMGQYEAVEAAVEAGEMAKVPASGLADFLGKFMEGYKELTGELPPGYYEPPNGFTLSDGIIKPVDTGVEQPDLPTQEVFNPNDPPKCTADVM